MGICFSTCIQFNNNINKLERVFKEQTVIMTEQEKNLNKQTIINKKLLDELGVLTNEKKNMKTFENI